ncbi:MAG: LysM peptidoglycan-binding domain-containing protein [bacterium]
MKRKWLYKVTPLSKYLSLVLFVVLPFIGFYLGLTHQTSDRQNKLTVNGRSDAYSSEKTIVLDKCSKYGINDNREDLYTSYTVKKGDSLLSVAKNQLNDTSRIGDIVAINQDLYPGLSIKSSFIEPGYKLYLPPSYVQRVEYIGSKPYLLHSYNGEISEILDNGMWRIHLNSQNLNHLVSISNQTLFLGKTKENYKIGDCISAIYSGGSIEVLAVRPQ